MKYDLFWKQPCPSSSREIIVQCWIKGLDIKRKAHVGAPLYSYNPTAVPEKDNTWQAATCQGRLSDTGDAEQ